MARPASPRTAVRELPPENPTCPCALVARHDSTSLREAGHVKAEAGRLLGDAGAGRICHPKHAFRDIEFKLVFQGQKILWWDLLTA